jgi:hypothetical protein
MYVINWHITIGNYKLLLLDSAEIHSSVDLLADTAIIKLPAMNLNKSLGVEAKIKIGDPVKIQAGYGDDLQPEFEGFVQRIATDDGSITLECEDGLYAFRKPVPDKAFKASSVKDVASYVASQVGGYSVKCDYDFTYDKFVISRATGYDVLKKLQEESKANVYLKGTELHIHPAYVEKFGDASYDFARNIEKSDLTYKRADERKYEVEVEGIDKDGKRVSQVIGTPGGDKRSIKIYGVSDPATLKTRGEEELKRISYDGYEGSITCWLLPICRPGFTAKIKDQEYPEKDGSYYVVAVTTKISSAGGVRTIQLGRRI